MSGIRRSRSFEPWSRASSWRRLLSLAMFSVLVFPAVARASQQQKQTAASRSAVLARAARLRAIHQPQAAADLLRPLAAQAPNDAELLIAYGGALLESGRLEPAETAFAHALAVDPRSIAANDAVGNLLLEQHQDPEAMDRFETVLATAPQNSVARQGEVKAATELALKARRDGHPDVALEVLRHACSKLPDDPQLLLDLGIEATELHQDTEAVQALQRALTLNAGNPTLLYALAHAEFDEQHMPDAERDFKAYLASRPDDASAHFGLGKLYEMEQQTTEARAQFESSLRLEPKQTASYYELGQMDLEAHDDADAQRLFERVLARDPSHAGALTGMGQISLRAKQYATAEAYLAKAEKADPTYAPPHYYRGLALAHMGRADEANQELHSGDGRIDATPNADDTGIAASPPPPTQSNPQ